MGVPILVPATVTDSGDGSNFVQDEPCMLSHSVIFKSGSQPDACRFSNSAAADMSLSLQQHTASLVSGPSEAHACQDHPKQ